MNQFRNCLAPSICIALVALFSPILRAQDTDAVSPETVHLIQHQLDLAPGSRFELELALSVDSVQGQQPTVDQPSALFHDTLASLQHCVIFLATNDHSSAPHSGLIGIFKEDNILWKSDTVINTDIVSPNEIVTIQDLNLGGRIDIVTSWIEGHPYGQGIEHWWIVSWDGRRGHFINRYHEGISEIRSIEDGFGIGAPDRNGIKPIIGVWVNNSQDSTTSRIVYRWNGKEYSKP
jgi:hypothetical protein